jgi:hypothetical protein
LRPDDDDFASIVVAQQFELINANGEAVADLVAPAAFARLQFHHLDTPTIGDSQLTWTTHGGTQDQVRLEGPVASGTNPLLNLVNGTTGGQAAIAYGASAVSVQGNSVDDGIALQPGARGTNLNGRRVYLPVGFAKGDLQGLIALGLGLTLIQFGPNFGAGEQGDIMVVSGTFRFDCSAVAAGTAVVVQPLFYDPNGLSFLDPHRLVGQASGIAGDVINLSGTWQYTLAASGAPARVEFYGFHTGGGGYNAVGTPVAPDSFSTGVLYGIR